MRLTEQQVNYFDTFGFLAFPGLFADEAGRISDAFESIWAMHGGGHDGRPHDHQRRSALIEFIDRDEFLCSLIDDPRIDDVAASLLGDDYNYTGSDGNYYVGDTQWHSDRYDPRKYMSFKMAFYLDPGDADSGCLRVIPGSHKFGDSYADSLQPVAQQPRPEQAPAMWGISPDQIPAVPLETPARRPHHVQPPHQARLLRRRHPTAHVHHQLPGALRRGGPAPAPRGGRRGRQVLEDSRLRRGHDPHRRPQANAPPWSRGSPTTATSPS